MFKKTVSKFFVAIFMTCSVAAFAQNPDTLKKDTVKTDTVKVDTVLLNKYRIETRKNALPVRIRPIQLQPEFIAVQMPEYEIRHWRKWFSMALNFNQSAFSNNWSSGGVSAIAIGTNVIYRTEYNKAPLVYTAEFNLLYGRSKNKGQSSRKTNDRIFIDNKLATKLSKNWYFFGSLTFESQFDKGFQYPDPNPPVMISNFMAPGYLTESIGFEYKPSKFFSARLGTGTARQTFVLDSNVRKVNKYGVEKGTVRNELAFQGVALFDKDIMQNIHLNTRYAIFIPYGRPMNFINHRLDVSIIAKVNKLINMSINGTAVYNEDAAAGIQATEGLALGIMYKFP